MKLAYPLLIPGAMFHHQGIKSYLAILCAVMALQPLSSFCAPLLEKSQVVAVLPFSDGDCDEESRVAAEMISDGLKFASPHRIIGPRVSEGVVEYHDENLTPGDAVVALEARLSDAKQDYFNFRYSDAMRGVDDVIEKLGGMKISVAGPYLVDAHLTRALIAKSRGDGAAIRESFSEALNVNPKLELFETDYPPSVMRSFALVKERMAEGSVGELEIVTRPGGATLLLNGISQCETPCVVNELPVNSYTVSVRANKYAPMERGVRIEEGKRVRIDEKLRWAKKGKVVKRNDDSITALRMGLHNAHLLKADRVVFIDVDGARDSLVTARLIDSRFAVALKPIIFEDAVEFGEVTVAADMTRAIIEQLEVDPSRDPMDLTDPVGMSDPILLGKHKKPLYRKPLFWGVVGVAVAGAIAGGVAAAMSGGGDGPGDLRVRFQQ